MESTIQKRLELHEKQLNNHEGRLIQVEAKQNALEFRQNSVEGELNKSKEKINNINITLAELKTQTKTGNKILYFIATMVASLVAKYFFDLLTLK